MKTTVDFDGRTYHLDLSSPLDISIPLRPGPENVNAWYCDPVRIEPVVMGDWVGEVKRGGSVNFRNVFLNPHGNGTHTECVGHISREDYSLNQCLREFFFFAELVSVKPEEKDGDRVITKQQLIQSCKYGNAPALVIRTVPNDVQKNNRHYSNTNPPYIDHEAAEWMVSRGIKHLLIDLPSVDRERDDGKLLAHHAFWNYPGQARTDATITELIYADDSIADGLYLLNLQITSLENDASPSKPILYGVRSSEFGV